MFLFVHFWSYIDPISIHGLELITNAQITSSQKTTCPTRFEIRIIVVLPILASDLLVSCIMTYYQQVHHIVNQIAHFIESILSNPFMEEYRPPTNPSAFTHFLHPQISVGFLLEAPIHNDNAN